LYSAATYKEFARWKAYDDAQDNFCVMNEEDKGAEYVDLLLNPERYTGYKGKSAHRIWNSIYLENCFRYCDLLKYEGCLKSLCTRLITLSWNFMEGRCWSLFRSTSLGKQCTSYNASLTSQKCAADHLLQASGR